MAETVPEMINRVCLAYMAIHEDVWARNEESIVVRTCAGVAHDVVDKLRKQLLEAEAERIAKEDK